MERRFFAILLILVVGLGPASVGASCLVGGCAMESMAGVAPAPHSRDRSAEHSNGHCGEAIAVETRSAPPVSLENCCRTIDEEKTLALSTSPVAGPTGLEPTPEAVAVGRDSIVAPAMAREAPPGNPPALFTLHAAFLI